MPDLDFENDGAQRFRCALSRGEVATLGAVLAQSGTDRAGVRLAGLAGLGDWVGSESAMGRIAALLIGSTAQPVRAVLFDKSVANNWTLPWHQDRTVVVRRRVEAEGYGPWSVKAGLVHVAPPIGVLEGMATLRLHLDVVDHENAPLLIARGSHRLGKIPESQIAEIVARHDTHACLADAGDVWAYSTPILHASKPAVSPRRRRVLQVDYAAQGLDGDLEWLGV